ncbi:MAG: formylglycine-generating enzyme family protein [Bryobacteraceae bacterium]|nr:formylglycine-generating enzyme family protein [Bryobacteraceae bacterium]MDW8379978.1 formylglycine-generating enzyme family protein [Bryobacterales bacterium]
MWWVAALAGLSFAAEPGMVFIPGGEFLRGRSYALPDDGLKWVPEVLMDDRPVRPVYVDPFYMDAHEVTNAEYAVFVQATKHRPPYHWPEGRVPAGKENHPVVNVSWEDASAYARWAGKRLPTEAEWERACRGLREGAKFWWGESKPTSEVARFNAVDGPQAVGQCKPNPFGLYDMAGNVWEWTADWYDRNYYATAPSRNPTGPATGRYRVIRGGSWADVEKYLTCAYRSWARPAERSPNIGFRCVKPVLRKPASD